MNVTVSELINSIGKLNLLEALFFFACLIAGLGVLADFIKSGAQGIGKLLYVILAGIVLTVIWMFALLIQKVTRKGFESKFVGALDFHQQRASTADDIAEEIFRQSLVDQAEKMGEQ